MCDPYKEGNIFEQLLKYELGKPAPQPLDSEVDRVHRLIMEDLKFRKGWTYVELQSFFLSLRHLIEIRNLQNEFQVLNFYCNWCAHIALTGSAVGYKMLVRMNQFFLMYFNEKGLKADEEYAAQLNDIFTVKHLVEGITKLLGLFQIENLPFVSIEKNHPILRDMLLSYLEGKSISFGNKYTDPADKAYKYFNPSWEQFKAAGIENQIIIRVTILNINGIRTLEIIRHASFPLLLSGYLR